LLAASSAADFILSAPLFTESRALFTLELDDKLSFYQTQDDRYINSFAYTLTASLTHSFALLAASIN